MEFFKDFLIKVLTDNRINITMQLPFNEVLVMFESECFVMLKKIKAVIDDESLNDKECYRKIEQIICLFEESGSSCNRHDY